MHQKANPSAGGAGVGNDALAESDAVTNFLVGLDKQAARITVREALDTLETAAEALEVAADDRWPTYTAERWRKLKRSLDILASDLRAEFGGWL